MEIKYIIDTLISDSIQLLVSLLLFLVELSILYKLYTILFKKFMKNKPAAEQMVFIAIFITIALYSFDLTGFPIAKTLIDTGILWVVTIIITLLLLYRITVTIENHFK